jgi:hypothetical protein
MDSPLPFVSLDGFDNFSNQYLLQQHVSKTARSYFRFRVDRLPRCAWVTPFFCCSFINRPPSNKEGRTGAGPAFLFPNLKN